MKSILFVIPSLHVGGAESQLALVLPQLQQRGWGITVFLTSGVGELAQSLAARGITVIKPWLLPEKTRITSKLLRAPIMALSFARLTLYLLRQRPQIVHFTLAEAYILGGLSGVLVGQRNLIMSRRSLNNYQSKHPLFAKLEHWLHRKMRVIIANSGTAITQLNEQEQVPVNKLQLIYNGLDMRRFDKTYDLAAIRNEFNLPLSALTLIVVANIIPYKGHATLLAALATIKEQLPSDWQLLCVGKKHDYYHELAALVSKLGLDQHVHFLGQQNAVERLWAISDLAISCSYEEGFSNAVIEANAAGVPIIVTNVGGNPEAVEDNHTGLVIPARDAPALSAAILNLVRNPSKAEALAVNGKQHVLKKFSLAACVDQYHALYASVC